jgi:hypothetical protein
MYLGDNIYAVHLDLRASRSTQCNVQNGAAFCDVDLLATPPQPTFSTTYAFQKAGFGTNQHQNSNEIAEVGVVRLKSLLLFAGTRPHQIEHILNTAISCADWVARLGAASNFAAREQRDIPPISVAQIEV